MRNFARDIYDENKRRNERLISLEALTMAELSQLSIFDDYDSNYIIMASYNYDIRIEDVLIAQAIGKLCNRTDRLKAPKNCMPKELKQQMNVKNKVINRLCHILALYR
ncbi:TPA: hypothetical protein ACGORC_001776 [Streptococcus suis]